MATKEIPEKISFGILGCIQMFPLAKIVTLLDQGHGLLERFLITVPLCLRPTPTQTKEAKERLSELPPVSYADIGSLLCEKLTPGTEFHFSDEASELINKLDEDFINEINEAISNGHVPPKSKRIDLLVRVSVAIHIITILTTSLLDGVSEELLNITSEIPLSIVEAALYYVDYCENQKAILSAFVMDIVAMVMDSPRTQPSSLAIKLATLLFPGKAVTYRSLRGSGSRSVRGITVQEFETAIDDLKELGKVTQVRVPRSAN
ncbi:hypothetical protein HOLleu_10146 [Holothuria leucospilota]|uniref:Uncharacterized protein n=1 Tax=Holothuria leucospilota TaxID=206669 RepID=A0A9Q1HFH4_HOLLE|nr:hypothetical protein HOLleu_10146 [Holothuria leucospilota]